MLALDARQLRVYFELLHALCFIALDVLCYIILRCSLARHTMNAIWGNVQKIYGIYLGIFST